MFGAINLQDRNSTLKPIKAFALSFLKVECLFFIFMQVSEAVNHVIQANILDFPMKMEYKNRKYYLNCRGIWVKLVLLRITFE